MQDSHSRTNWEDYNATCRSHCKARTLCDQMYAKVHVVTPITKVHLVTPTSKVHLVTLLYTDDVNYSLNPTTCKI